MISIDNVTDAFWLDRGISLGDSAIFLIVQTLVARFIPKLVELSGRLSLRTRISFGVMTLAMISGIAIYQGIPPYFAMVVFALSSLVLIHFVLADLSMLGIVNAFRSTRKGVTSEASLKAVQTKFDFLGIGAKKLSQLEEFKAVMRRAKTANKRIRLLLSNPQNKALQELAARNGLDKHAYSSRVRDSIRHLLHLNSAADGGVLDIKLYDLESDFAMPHFRLMFIDERLCLFSHVIWNDKEGEDNPQLLIRNKPIKSMSEASFYNAYHRYFEDLWNSSDATKIEEITDPRIAV